MKNRRSPILIVSTLCLFASSALSAQSITYVDASHGASGNTFATGKPPGYKRWFSQPDAPSAQNEKWVRRTDGGNEGNVYQAAIQSNNAIPQLTTQLRGLSDGVYDIWVFAWDSPQSWQIDAGLKANELHTFTLDGPEAVEAKDLPMKSPIITRQDNRKLHGIYVGQARVENGNPISIYIDSAASNSSKQKDRTWYDGVGYAPSSAGAPLHYASIPEPSFNGLYLGLVAAIYLNRRRPHRHSA